MTQRLRKAVIFATLLSLVISAISPNVYSQGRLGRAPARDAEGSSPLPVGTTTIPAGTIIILEIDDQLSSAGSKVSDRFRAHVVSPVVDGANKTLIPVGIVVEGHVSSVSKAKWRHRSGVLAIVFDNFRRPNGDPVPVKGTLTSASAEDRKRMDEEAYLKGDSSLKRDIAFIGGGAGAGAAIGVFTGGALMGAGIGAAVGLTAALLMKGKDVTIEPGQRFGMILTQQISSNLFQANASPIPTPVPTPIPTPVPFPPNPNPNPYPYQPTPTPTPSGPLPGPLSPYEATTIREGDGSVKLRVNADAPSSGWRVFSNHENLANGLVRIRLRGTPPRSTGVEPRFQQSAILPVPEICLDDKSGLLRRAEFMDKYGRSSFSVEIPYQPGTRYGRAPASAPYNAGNSGTNYSTPGYPNGTIPVGTTPPTTNQPGTSLPTPTTSIAVQAQSAAAKVDYIRRQYANDLGYMINRTGPPTFIGQQPPSADQKQFFDGLMALHASLLRLQTGATDANSVRSNARRVQEDAELTNQTWKRVRLDSNMNSRWQAAYAEINSLLGVALR
ncbi:MAG TPA: hypothetical protein PLK30_01240 [Blastocatellia bacterium]|nr:hypothetical protein [Blastocatellia bacterium]